jgi:hypothetical protein
MPAFTAYKHGMMEVFRLDAFALQLRIGDRVDMGSSKVIGPSSVAEVCKIALIPGIEGAGKWTSVYVIRLVDA